MASCPPPDVMVTGLSACLLVPRACQCGGKASWVLRVEVNAQVRQIPGCEAQEMK